MLILIGLTAMAILAARQWATDPSFGRYGHYRGDSVAEIAAQVPKHRGARHCASCHRERVGFWRTGKHHGVQCEVCHGPAGDHPRHAMRIAREPIRLCALCHEAMPARPAKAVRQVVLAQHMGGQSCIECHNPHDPAHFTWDEAVPGQ
ncbi:MAG: cytochrome c3 family protein [Mariprofundaceae bacterium]